MSLYKVFCLFCLYLCISSTYKLRTSHIQSKVASTIKQCRTCRINSPNLRSKDQSRDEIDDDKSNGISDSHVKDTNMFSVVPVSNSESILKKNKRILSGIYAPMVAFLGLGLRGKRSTASTANLAISNDNYDDFLVDLDADRYNIAPINKPSDDFWYPPYCIGKWNTTLTFDGAKFSEDIPVSTLSKHDVAGFSKYSVIFFPDLGKDVYNLIRRFVQIDSHPREDHPFNIRKLVSSFLPTSQIVTAPYSFQKAPDWLYSPSNKWQIKYQDSDDRTEGVVDLLTLKRDIKVFAGSLDTIEFFRQVRFILLFTLYI